MDKRLVGKWYKEELGETINIFDSEPPKMKMSFTSSGYYNVEPNCVYEKDGYLCYEINDERHRMVYHVRYSEGCLEGWYTRFGNDTPVKYERISDEPKDGEFRSETSLQFVPGTQMSRLEALKKHSEYDREAKFEPFATEYKLYGDVPEILHKYDYSKYIDGIDSSDDRLVFSLLDFVCDNFGHNGSIGMPAERKIEDIIEFCEAHDRTTNCRGLAILLASLLRLNGIKARHITCMPYEDPFEDCHVVVDCELPSGKRIMLDPSWRLWFTDTEGEYISLPRLRQLLIDGGTVSGNETASHNGTAFDTKYYCEYMTKNTFRFARGIHFEDGKDEHSLELIPKDYPTDNFDENQKKIFIYNDTDFWKM